MSYPFKWFSDRNVAVFVVEGEDYEFTLPDFVTAQRICKLIDTAFESGADFGANSVAIAAKNAIDKRTEALSKFSGR